MFKLEKALKEWVAQGFLNPEQAQQITHYENTRPGSSWVLTGLLILGTVVIGTGVVSLIAANWYQIPPFMKLSLDFALLLGLAWGVIQAANSTKTVLYEILLLAFLLLCLASIGLIAQIYNIGGEFYQALLLWSGITFGIAIVARHVFVPFVWVAGLLVGLVFTALESPTFHPLFYGNDAAVFMAVPLFCFAFIVFIRSLSEQSVLVDALRSWTLVTGLIALIVAESTGFVDKRHLNDIVSYLPGYFFAIIVIVGVLANKQYRNSQKVLLLLVLAVYLLLFRLPLLDIHSKVIYAIFTLAILAMIAIFMASLRKQRLFQWFLFFMGVRFVLLYFQALGGLVTTGIGLIVSGVFIIALAVLWQKYRKPLAISMERWMQ